MGENGRKSIKVMADPIQVDILKRSVIAETLKTIHFGWTKLRRNGRVRVRDTALVSPGLKSLFFEIKPQWEFLVVRSRRVWIEITGVPVRLWSVDTFMRIGKIWEKPVMLDELTDYYLSYTCGSMLIDSFQWELIHEWVTLEEGEYKFEVYVKEFEREIYSAQIHPGNAFEDSLCQESGYSEGGKGDNEKENQEVVLE
ncbi:hypothetical protein PIB30_031863 [Stylosanthes scabra]|uniref:DUF4283 domain-containing protein n=1 Tax=Stylosanthes scabra TaxID=79078 RepID=A0ABU6UAS0_9FABA|nr:hypothetical protein [Stylosanthes scabra]